MRLTGVRPVQAITNDMYREERHAALLPHELDPSKVPSEVYIARLKGVWNRAFDYCVKIVELDDNSPSHVHWSRDETDIHSGTVTVGLWLVRFMPVNGEGEPLKNRPTTRIFDGDGVIRSTVMDNDGGYFRN